MNILILTANLLQLGLSAIPTAAEPAEPLEIRRFTLIVSANDGGSERAMLRYAETDASAVAEVLRSLGGVDVKDEYRLNQPSAQALRLAFAGLAPQLKAAKRSAHRLELVMYYSGHSDTQGLLLGSELFSYKELKEQLNALPTDVRIAILDACSSGAMTRQKGGVRRPPFMIDASNRVHGYAVLTSSSEDETAQESDNIGASFFTHYLVSALRGAADVSEDRRVTLNEAYNFAFHETLTRTQNTLGGPQHPAYDIQLVGTGDVVMTDLRSTNSSLMIPKDVYGRFYVRDAADQLAVEIRKIEGRATEIGLDPGTYSVILEQDRFKYQGTIDLIDKQQTKLQLAHFSHIDDEQTTLRGLRKNPVRKKTSHVDVGLFPPFSLNSTTKASLNNISLNLFLGHSYNLEGLGLALGGSWVDNRFEGLQATLGFNHAGQSAQGIQLTLGFNNVGGYMAGWQSALGFNIVGDSFAGAQLSNGFNFVGNDSYGIQGSLGANIALGGFKGIQGTLGVNVVDGPLMGMQISSGINVATATITGGQLSAGINYAHQRVKGLQVSSLNMARNGIEGAQFGFVNLGRSSTFQLGIINIVEETKGPSIGLINYAYKDGILDFKLYTSDIALGGVAFEIGNKYTYTSVSVAGGTWEDTSRYGFGIYFGTRFYPTSTFEIGFELGTQVMPPTTGGDMHDTSSLSSLRLELGYRFTPKLALFGGPALHILYDGSVHSGSSSDSQLAPKYAFQPNIGDDQPDYLYLWPGVTLGLRML